MQPRRWKRLSLRSALVLLTMLCIALGVWSYRARAQRSSVTAIEAVGGRIIYAHKSGNVYKTRTGMPPNDNSLRARLADVMGQDYFYGVRGVTLYPDASQTADEQVKLLDGLHQLEYVAIWPEAKGRTTAIRDARGGLSDEGADYLLAHHRLTRVSLTSARLSDGATKRLIDATGDHSQIDRHSDFMPAT
jgi:hypothetical protein